MGISSIFLGQPEFICGCPVDKLLKKLGRALPQMGLKTDKSQMCPIREPLCHVYWLVPVVAVELCGRADQFVVDGCHSAQVAVLVLPRDVRVPKLVRLELQTRWCKSSIVKSAENTKSRLHHSMSKMLDRYSYFQNLIFQIC